MTTATTSTQTPTITVSGLRPASGPGALAAYDVLCTECGVHASSTMRSLAAQYAAEHAAWHDRRR